MEKADPQTLKKLRGVAALWNLGLMKPDELIDATTEALVDGLDNTTLEVIAGLTKPNDFEIKQLAKKMFNEFGMLAVSAQEEALEAADYLADRAITGKIDPLESVERLRLICDVFGDWNNRIIPESVQQAFVRIAKVQAKSIADRQIDPYEGADPLFSPWTACGMPDELAPLIQLVNDYEYPESLGDMRKCKEIAEDIVTEARRLTNQ